MNKLIINFTPTGMIPTKADNSNVPITPCQIVEDIRRACELGITMVHLHARDSQTQKPTYKKEVHAEIIGGIWELALELMLCVSTSRRTFNKFAKRSDVLQLQGDLKPDLTSLKLSSLNFNKPASNLNLLERIHMIAQVNQRDIMKPAELREVLKLNKC